MSDMLSFRGNFDGFSKFRCVLIRSIRSKLKNPCVVADMPMYRRRSTENKGLLDILLPTRSELIQFTTNKMLDFSSRPKSARLDMVRTFATCSCHFIIFFLHFWSLQPRILSSVKDTVLAGTNYFDPLFNPLPVGILQCISNVAEGGGR